MKPKNKKRWVMAAVVSVVLLLLVIAAARWGGKRLTAIGHSGGPMLGILYEAAGEPRWNDTFLLTKLGTSADIGYALLAGDIAAGFVEPSKIPAMEKLRGFNKLAAVGKVTFPYGATLILREGLSLRINELDGLTIGISSPDCVLLEAFKEDAARLGLDLDSLQYETLAFDAMIPALEAGIIDAAVIKASYALIAQKEGHSLLYQNWEVQPGDECCPVIIEQLQFVLLAHRDKTEASLLLPQRLLEAQSRETAVLRAAIHRETAIPLSLLEGLPVAEFAPADNGLIEILVGHTHEEGEEHHDEEE